MNLCLRPSLQKVQVSENNSSNKTAREASIEANNFVKNVFNNEHCLQELFQNVLLILNNFATIVNNFFLYSKKFLKCTKQFPKQLNNCENNLTIYRRFFLAFPPQLFLNPFNIYVYRTVNCYAPPQARSTTGQKTRGRPLWKTGGREERVFFSRTPHTGVPHHLFELRFFRCASQKRSFLPHQRDANRST